MQSYTYRTLPGIDPEPVKPLTSKERRTLASLEATIKRCLPAALEQLEAFERAERFRSMLRETQIKLAQEALEACTPEQRERLFAERGAAQ
jgi:hypothetical protein